MTLVVIHGNYDVEPAAECLGKDAVRRRRRLFRNTDTLSQRQIDGGLNFIDFLVSEHTIFAAVRVESRDGNLRCFYAEGLAGVICDADAVEHARRFDAVACLTQRNMRGNMHHAQRVVREHHGIFARISVVGINFRMAGIVMTRHVDGLFADGVGHRCVDFALHGKLDNRLDILECSLAAEFACAHAEGLRRFLVQRIGNCVFRHETEVQHINCARGKKRVFHRLDAVKHWCGSSELFRHAAGVGQACVISYHQGTAACVNRGVAECADCYFWAISEGVSHGDANNRTFDMHICHLKKAPYLYFPA